MNIYNLKTDVEIKNYKSLCELLNIPTKTGNAKLAQLKELSRYCKYEKIKNSFVIKEIYKVPLPPNNNVTKYIPFIEKLILHIIFENGADKTLHINKSKLYETMKMINDKYSAMKYHKMQLSKKYNIDSLTIKDFYNTSDDLLERNVNQALKSLENQSLLKYNEVYSVCTVEVKEVYSELTIDNHVDDYGDNKNTPRYNTLNKVERVHRQATEDETRVILALQRQQLDLLGCHDMRDLYNKGLKREFYQPIKKYLLDNYNIEYYYNSYELIFNRNHITEAYVKNQSYLLDEESYYLFSNLLNDNISDKLKNMAESRRDNCLKLEYKNAIQENRSKDNYLSDIQKLINNLIHSK